MSMWFEYIENEIDPKLIRELCKLDDEALKLSMATVVCAIAGGLREIPTGGHRREFAKKLIALQRDKQYIIEATRISERTYFNLKKEVNNGQK